MDTQRERDYWDHAWNTAIPVDELREALAPLPDSYRVFRIPTTGNLGLVVDGKMVGYVDLFSAEVVLGGP